MRGGGRYLRSVNALFLMGLAIPLQAVVIPVYLIIIRLRMYDTLLAMIKQDREWKEGAAKARLLTLFEALGLEDPWVSAQRRRLSAILFG